MTRKVLDLFCGAGGAAMGYHRAGFEVIGVDIDPQPHYPFAYIQMDAIALLHEEMGWVRTNFDLIHASPPCQNYSVLKALHRDMTYPDLVDITRLYLDNTHLPYVIENVGGAPLHDPIRLCGTMFSLRLFRHRYFEIGCNRKKLTIPTPEHVPHRKQNLKAPKTSREPNYEDGEVHSIYGHFSGVETAREAMQIGWMTRDELAQAIPPAYTCYIAKQLAAQRVNN